MRAHLDIQNQLLLSELVWRDWERVGPGRELSESSHFDQRETQGRAQGR